MRILITIAVICLLLIGCQLSLDTALTPVAQTSAVTAESETSINGQIFYTNQQVLDAAVWNGDIHFQFQLEDFKAIYLLGQAHAYVTSADSEGNFRFHGIEDGEYSLIAKLIPAHGEIFQDGTIEYLPNGKPFWIIGQNSERYKIGVVDTVHVSRGTANTMSLMHVQKLFLDDTGSLDCTQHLGSNNNRERWTGEQVNLGRIGVI